MFLRRVFTGPAAPRAAIAWGRFYSVAAGDKVGVSYVGTLEDGTVLYCIPPLAWKISFLSFQCWL